MTLLILKNKLKIAIAIAKILSPVALFKTED